jgi:hypothetical protein
VTRSSCRPGNRLDDLGYLAWTWCIQSRGHVPVGEQARQLRDGYGAIAPEILLAAMIHSQDRIVDTETANLASTGHSAARRQHAKAAIAWASADRALLRQHEALLLSVLR